MCLEQSFQVSVAGEESAAVRPIAALIFHAWMEKRTIRFDEEAVFEASFAMFPVTIKDLLEILQEIHGSAFEFVVHQGECIPRA